MIWIIGLPFATLIAIILVVRVMRGLRHAQELQSRRRELDFAAGPPDRRRPSDDFHDGVWLPLCDRVADAATAKLGRPLNEPERRAVWRARSPLVLEVALKEIEAAPDAAAALACLAALPTGMARPDPTCWCDRPE